MLLPVELFSDQEHEFENIYPLASSDAFKAVNGAVFYTLQRCCSHGPIMSNKELAQRIDLPYQTFRNKLSEMHQRKNVPRGVPRGEGQARKEKHRKR